MMALQIPPPASDPIDEQQSILAGHGHPLTPLPGTEITFDSSPGGVRRFDWLSEQSIPLQGDAAG
jgi:hypothetical protein